MRFPPRTAQIFGIFLIAHVASFGDEGPSRDEVFKQTKANWEALSTFEFKYHESAADAEGRLDRTKAALLMTFRFASSDRWSVDATAPLGGGGVSRNTTVVDGKKSYRASFAPDHPDFMYQLGITVPKEEETLSPPGGCILTMLLRPGGYPVHTHLANGATLENKSDSQGRRSIVISSQLKGNPLLITIDPDHDWLASEVVLGRVLPSTRRVTRFARLNGRWFPIEGIHERDGATDGLKPGIRRRAFAVSDLSINKPLASPISPPRPQDGTLIADQIKGEFKSHGKPSRVATTDLKAEPPKSSKPLVADSPSSTGSFSAPLLAAGVGMLLCGLFLYRRR